MFGAAYSLWMYKRVVFGEVANEHVAALTDVERARVPDPAAAGRGRAVDGRVSEAGHRPDGRLGHAADRARAAEQAADRDGAQHVGRPDHGQPEPPRRAARDRPAGRGVRDPGRRPLRAGRAPQRRPYGLSMAALRRGRRRAAGCSSAAAMRDLRLQRHVRRRPDDERAQAVLGARRRLHARLRAGLRARPRHVEGRALHADAVRAARDHADDLGEQPAGDLPRPRAAGAVAVRAGRAAPRRRALERGGDEVLRARRAGVGLPAVRHVDAVRRQRHARHQRAGAARRDRPGGQPRVAGARRRVRDRRPRVQARRGAVPHVGARRLPGRADAGDAADRLRAEARDLRRRLPHPRRGAAAARGRLAEDADRAGGRVAGARQPHRDRADQPEADAGVLDHRADGLHAARDAVGRRRRATRRPRRPPTAPRCST